MALKEFIASFKPGFDPVPLSEKIRSALAVTVGLLLTGLCVHWVPQAGYPMVLLVSMGASAALMFTMPHSPMSQPWPVAGGHMVSALVGWACGFLVHDPVAGGAIAVGLSVLLMHLLRCLHPPGAALALSIVLNAGYFHLDDWKWLAATVFANIVFLLLMAIAINSLIRPGGYPVPYSPRHPPVTPPGELSKEDIEWALGKMEGSMDVSETDLLEIYRLATEHAHGKQACS